MNTTQMKFSAIAAIGVLVGVLFVTAVPASAGQIVPTVTINLPVVFFSAQTKVALEPCPGSSVNMEADVNNRLMASYLPFLHPIGFPSDDGFLQPDNLNKIMADTVNRHSICKDDGTGAFNTPVVSNDFKTIAKNPFAIISVEFPILV